MNPCCGAFTIHPPPAIVPPAASTFSLWVLRNCWSYFHNSQLMTRIQNRPARSAPASPPPGSPRPSPTGKTGSRAMFATPATPQAPPPRSALTLGRRRGQQHIPHPFRERLSAACARSSSMPRTLPRSPSCRWIWCGAAAFIAHRRRCEGWEAGFGPHAASAPQRTGHGAVPSRFLAKGRGVIGLPLQQPQVATRVTRFQRFCLIASELLHRLACFAALSL